MATLDINSSQTPVPFWREQFQVLLVASLFLVTFAVFVSNLGGPDIRIWVKDICQAFLYAFLAMLGVRRVPAPAIGPLATDSGDINMNAPAAPVVVSAEVPVAADDDKIPAVPVTGTDQTTEEENG